MEEILTNFYQNHPLISILIVAFLVIFFIREIIKEKKIDPTDVIFWIWYFLFWLFCISLWLYLLKLILPIINLNIVFIIITSLIWGTIHFLRNEKHWE